MTSGATRSASSAQLDDLVVQLGAAAAAEDHVDLFLLPWLCPNGRADVGREALVGEADALGLERTSGEARLERPASSRT